jgi:hypothetical protein
MDPPASLGTSEVVLVLWTGRIYLRMFLRIDE